MEAKTEWKIGGGVTHSSPTAPHPLTQISEFGLGLGEGTKVFFLTFRDQTTGDLKSYHLQAGATLTAMTVPHGHLFFLQKGNPLIRARAPMLPHLTGTALTK